MTIKNALCTLILLVFTSLLTSCATIIGGSKYSAIVLVPDYPNAKIEYRGEYKGTGEAKFKVMRKEANNFSVTIKEEGCDTQTNDFTQRSFRGWAFTGTVLGWTGVAGGIPLPWGVMVDGATGAWWKPNTNEKGVTKEDLNHYIYLIDYAGCSSKPE